MIISLLLILPIVIYSLRVIVFSIGASRARKMSFPEPNDNYQPFVSIVIPSRNEESNISRCIKSFEKSTYPKDKFEIIVVNDRSEDATGKILSELSKKVSNLKVNNLRVVTITEEPVDKNLQGKPGAIQAGIDAAKGELILMTDADCTVSDDWIETHVNGFADPDVGMIASFTLVEDKTIFHRLQAIEWIFMETMASGGIGLHQPLGCFGNNVAVRKKDFDDLGGYRKIDFSVTEDLALMSAVFKTGRKVKFFCNPASTVTTLPCQTLKEYILQHQRWAIGGQALGWRATIFVLASIAIWAGIATSVATSNWLFLAVILGVRLFGDFIVLTPSLRVLKKSRLIKWIFPSVLFFMLIELIVPFLILNRNVKWKGQVFR